MSFLMLSPGGAAKKKQVKLFDTGETPLSKGLDDTQKDWLLEYAVQRWGALHSALMDWRNRLSRFERMADDNLSDRTVPDRSKSDAPRSIFERQNHTLGLVAGKCDQVYAQAKDDIFGTRPWLAATPQGADDTELADRVTKHSQWKFDQSNLEATLDDALKVAIHLGTAFPKLRWLKEVETFETVAHVAFYEGTVCLKPDGDFVTTDEELAAWLEMNSQRQVPSDQSAVINEQPGTAETAPTVQAGQAPGAAGETAEQPVTGGPGGPRSREEEQPPTDQVDNKVDAPYSPVEWREMLISETTEVYNNVEAAVLDFKDVAFDPLAAALELRNTDFFCRFKMGVHDLAAAYEMTAEQKDDLIACAQLSSGEEAREHRGETVDSATPYSLDPEANPVVWLVEGFVRCDPFNTGKPVRLHVIFSPELHALFRCDYLANVTPGGLLPVFPVRCFKDPRRIIGKGYWERFEDANDAVDGLYNATTVRNRKQADVFKAFNKSALANESEGEDVVNHPEKLFELKPDKTIDDLFGFKVMPDANGRTDQLLQQMLQMANLRMGTSSASQGMMTGIPENDTATGSKINAGRAMVLDKAQIAQMMGDLRPAVEFAVHLNYANQDVDETFTWGEGKDAELMEIKAGDVKGLRANVSLNLTQSQNLQKLESAKAAIEIAMQYTTVPEPEKPALRRLFKQAIGAMGFNDADRIIREGVVDAAGIAALLPPEMQEAWGVFAQQMGMAPPVEESSQMTGAE